MVQVYKSKCHSYLLLCLQSYPVNLGMYPQFINFCFNNTFNFSSVTSKGVNSHTNIFLHLNSQYIFVIFHTFIVTIYASGCWAHQLFCETILWTKLCFFRVTGWIQVNWNFPEGSCVYIFVAINYGLFIVLLIMCSIL